MQEVGAEVDDIGEELLDRFVAEERSRDVVCVTVKSSMSTMCRFLTDARYLGQPLPALVRSRPRGRQSRSGVPGCVTSAA
jgi:hypothetical protein